MPYRLDSSKLATDGAGASLSSPALRCVLLTRSIQILVPSRERRRDTRTAGKRALARVDISFLLCAASPQGPHGKKAIELAPRSYRISDIPSESLALGCGACGYTHPPELRSPSHHDHDHRCRINTRAWAGRGQTGPEGRGTIKKDGYFAW